MNRKLASNYNLGLRLKIATDVTSYYPFDLLEKNKTSEDSIVVKVVVEVSVNTYRLAEIMKQRKKERDFFGMLGKESEDVKDKALVRNLTALSSQFILTSLTLKNQ